MEHKIVLRTKKETRKWYKREISMPGAALLVIEESGNTVIPIVSTQMPEDVVDEILHFRYRIEELEERLRALELLPKQDERPAFFRRIMD